MGRRHAPYAISSAEHYVSADRSWHVEVNLHIVRRRLLQGDPVHLGEHVKLPLTSFCEAVHQHLPRSTPPAVGDALERPLPQLALLRRLDVPHVNVPSLITRSSNQHAAPFCRPLQLLDGRVGRDCFGERGSSG